MFFCCSALGVTIKRVGKQFLVSYRSSPVPAMDSLPAALSTDAQQRQASGAVVCVGQSRSMQDLERGDSLDAELTRRGVTVSSSPSGLAEASRKAPLAPDCTSSAPRLLHGNRQAQVAEPRGAFHDVRSGSQNVGNHIGTKSTVRQSKLFRMYESGNATKAILGQQNLQWNVNEKEGAYNGRAHDDFKGARYLGAGDEGREVTRTRLGDRQNSSLLDDGSSSSQWETSSSCYGQPRRRAS